MASSYDVDVIILSMNRIRETLDAIDSARAQLISALDAFLQPL